MHKEREKKQLFTKLWHEQKRRKRRLFVVIIAYLLRFEHVFKL